jgi:hypothetical protein
VNRVPLKKHVAIDAVVRIRQIDGQLNVVFAHRRAEQQRSPILHQQPQPAEKPCPLVIQSLLAQARRLNVAITVEYGERVALLEYARLLVNARGGGEDVKPVVDLDDLFRRVNRRR